MACVSDNVKPARAEISAETVTAYFIELEKSLDGIDPTMIFNYDVINVKAGNCLHTR